MGYGLILNLHQLAMAVWVLSMIVAPLMVARRRDPAVGRRILRTVATPAMVLTWLFGIWLAVQGGWFTMGWLHVKLLLVLALSALHGIALGRLRRMAPGGEVPGLVRVLPWLTILLAVGAVLLALWKPF
ncbi:MAG TPA: CopD family protein [Rubellimicrobium sp.]|nr:CopD family protein [Rubellimicrobium sp.]